MKKIFLVLMQVILLAFCFGGCSLGDAEGESSSSERRRGTGKELGSRQKLRVANWNVQTFFDSTTSGLEYDEFKKDGSWGQEAYTVRLERLCQVIKALDADVFVMEEIENEGVMMDISNFLAGEWDKKKVYAYGCFAKDFGAAIGCGVLSRWPISGLTVHGVDFRKQKSDMPRMRPLMQLSVCKGSRMLTLMVNHWKSMSGGENATEKWRNVQESVLSRKVGEELALGKAVLCCGDFNRDIGKFKKGADSGTILLRELAFGKQNDFGVEVLSPWYDFSQSLVEPGSYYFNGEWSRIDQFFYAGDAEVEYFEAAASEPWSEGESKIPKKYKIWNGSGFSDHLPIVCDVSF